MEQSYRNSKNLYLRNVEKDDINMKLSETLNISIEQSAVLLNAINSLKPSKKCYSVEFRYPHHNPGMLGLMVMIDSYSIDLNKLALRFLSILLGFTPLSGAMSIIENLHDFFEAIKLLDPIEKMVYLLLKEFSGDGKDELETCNIYKCFLFNGGGNSPIFKSEAEIFDVIDNLANKGLLEIRTRTVKVKC